MYRKRFDLASSQAMRRLVKSDIAARYAVAHRPIGGHLYEHGGNLLERRPYER
jgi:hypothetical protein